jgi:hypothetical protein
MTGRTTSSSRHSGRTCGAPSAAISAPLFDRIGDDKRVFIVDLFAGERALPANMTEVMARRDEIGYSERVRSDLRFRETVGAYRALINRILGHVDPASLAKIKQWPLYIELMEDDAPVRITRFVQAGSAGELSSRDCDLSKASIRFNQSGGDELVKKTLRPLS